MKLNEAKYRSPEWLRNFVDFEVNTGEDIKGEPSKRKAAALEKERVAELKRQMDQREKDRKKADDIRREQQARADVRREKERQEQIERELNTIYNSLISDFQSAPYSDKIKTPTVNGQNAFHYTFENGKVIKVEDNRIYWDSSIYTIGVNNRRRFILLANEMIKKGKVRPTKSSSGYDRYNSYSKSSSGKGSSSSSQSSSSTKWKDHPKGAMYQSLKDTVKLREEQLKKATGSDRDALQNELNAAKKMLNNLRVKYQFENIKSFDEFNQIFENLIR
jgi:hypothetical protein